MNARALAEHGWPCPTGAEMRAIDERAIKEQGIPARLLMENAARACALGVRQQWPGVRRPLVLCGGGNNGGDGLALARILADWDPRVRPSAAVLGSAERYSPEARENLELLARSGVQIVQLRAERDVRPLLAEADLVVDALLGVGVSRPVEGLVRELLALLVDCAVPVAAIDLPSGTSSDTGAALGPEPRTDLVLTLGLPKLGLALRPRAARTRVADIGLPWRCVEATSIRQTLWTPPAAARHLPARLLEGHKGTFGHVLVVAGAVGTTGAACLAADGALHAGAGLVTVAIARAAQPVVASKLTEAMTLPLDDAASGALHPAALESLRAAVATRDVLVIGPGVGRAPATVEVVRALLAATRAPAVVDADALNAFEGDAAGLRGPGARVLTPHPGELARLLGQSTEAVQADRVGAARELARRSGAVVLHKGARSVIAHPDGLVRINPTGGPGLATGGTGDVLAGVVGALLAAGLTPFDAAALGAWLHGAAVGPLGDVGVRAGDVARGIPDAWRALAARRDELDGDDLGRPFP